MLAKLWSLSKGKKTILGSIGLFLTKGASGMGWIPPEVSSWLEGLFMGLMGVGIADRASAYKVK